MKSQTRFHLAITPADTHFEAFHMVSNAGGVKNNKVVLNILKKVMQENRHCEWYSHMSGDMKVLIVIYF